MKTNIKKIIQIIIAIVIPLLVGGISALLSSKGMKDFMNINQPPLSPPPWLFPVAWTILYILMGISSYLIYTSDSSEKDKNTALTLYGVQLLLNFIWSPLFFNFKAYIISFIVLLIMWITIIALILKCREINKTASILLIPYILWSTFALYLNLGVALLN